MVGKPEVEAEADGAVEEGEMPPEVLRRRSRSFEPMTVKRKDHAESAAS